jgi:hypothetical protein
MIPIKPDDIIIIDNGDTFEGTAAQFADCHFSNLTVPNIIAWCARERMECVIKQIVYSTALGALSEHRATITTSYYPEP